MIIKTRDKVLWNSWNDAARLHYGTVVAVYEGDRAGVRYPSERRTRVIRCSRLTVVDKIPAKQYASFNAPTG